MFPTNGDYVEDSTIATMSKPKRSVHWILWSAFIFIVIALFWAKYAVLDEVTVGEGKVVPSSKIQVIQNLEGGIVEKLMVRDGQIVEKDQLLMIIDDTRFEASYNEALSKARAIRAKIERLQAEVDSKQFIVPTIIKKEYRKAMQNEVALYESRKKELATKLTTLKQQRDQRTQELSELKAKSKQIEISLKLANKELRLTKSLVKHGAVSEVEVIRLERTTNDLKGQLESSNLSMPRIQSAIDEANSKINEMKVSTQTKILDELSAAKTELSSLNESNKALQDRVKRTEVRSPIRGTIKDIKITTVGGVIKPGMDLMEIVPLDDTLLIEAYIKPSKIGFLRPGQKAMVKISAFDFSIYGGLKGTVEHISADTIKKEEDDESYYKIYVRTQKNFLGKDNKPLVIMPGMQASVDILTGEKTVLDYILKPILKAKQEALRER